MLFSTDLKYLGLNMGVPCHMIFKKVVNSTEIKNTEKKMGFYKLCN